MTGEAPAGGALQAGGAEGVKAQLGSAAVDVVGDLLQGLKVGDIGDLIAGLLQQSLVDDDAKGLIAVVDGHGLAVGILQVEVLGGHFLHDVGVIQRIAEIAIGVDGALVAHLEHGGRSGLVQLGGQHGVILAGGGGDDLDLHAGLLGVGLGQILPGLVGLGLEVQVIHGALGLRAAVCGGLGAGYQGQSHDSGQDQCKSFLHDQFSFIIYFSGGFRRKN